MEKKFELPDTLVLEVLAKDFEGAWFQSNISCPLARAANRQFRRDDCREGVDIIKIDGLMYEHEPYCRLRYGEDYELALTMQPYEVVRRIELKRS